MISWIKCPIFQILNLEKLMIIKSLKIILTKILKILKILMRIFNLRIMNLIIIWLIKFQLIISNQIINYKIFQLMQIKKDLILKNWKNLLEIKKFKQKLKILLKAQEWTLRKKKIKMK